MQTTYVGNRAEAAAASYLQRQGFAIVAQNWRRPQCEIDIVAAKAGVIHFVEVKYRSSGQTGNGLDYITPAKLRRMAFAAELWVASYGWAGEYCLAAVEVGEGYRVTGFIEDIVA